MVSIPQHGTWGARHWTSPQHRLSIGQQVDHTLKFIGAGAIATAIIKAIGAASGLHMSLGVSLALSFGIGPALWLGMQLLYNIQMLAFRLLFPNKYNAYLEYRSRVQDLYRRQKRISPRSSEYSEINAEIKELRSWYRENRDWDCYKSRIDRTFNWRNKHLKGTEEYERFNRELESLGCGYRDVEEWNGAKGELDILYNERKQYRNGAETYYRLEQEIGDFRCSLLEGETWSDFQDRIDTLFAKDAAPREIIAAGCPYTDFRDWKQVRRQLSKLYSQRARVRSNYEKWVEKYEAIAKYHCQVQQFDGVRQTYGDVAYIPAIAMWIALISTCVAAFFIINVTVGPIGVLPFIGIVLSAIMLYAILPSPSSVVKYVRYIAMPRGDEIEVPIFKRILGVKPEVRQDWGYQIEVLS